MRSQPAPPRHVAISPPAKLNLFLELQARRADGYHELETVMVAIDRCDRMFIRRTSEDSVRLDCRWAPSLGIWRRRLGNRDRGLALPDPAQNLVVRALRRYLERTGQGGGFEVQLEKQIPAGAGMGGASSDAASALLGAAALCGGDATDPVLWETAAELGSDVPFFLGAAGAVAGALNAEKAGTERSSGSLSHRLSRGVAVASGRGERIEMATSAPDLHFVVLYPPEPLSTAAVYGRARVPESPVPAAGCVRAIPTGRGNHWADGLFNRLTEPARHLSPWIDQSLEALRRVGLAAAAMTGSGSACFALAPSARAARRAVAQLSSRRLGICFYASPTRVPAPVRFLT